MALLVTSAPDPAVVGTATNLQNLLSIVKSETWIFCCNFLVEYKVFDIFAKSSTAPPPIAIIRSGEKSFNFFIEIIRSTKSE